LKKIILIILFPLNYLFAIEVSCNFEEVYQNGEIQQGVFLIKNQMFRYEYYDQDLFTIISKKNNYYLVKNNTKTVQKIDKNTDTIKALVEIISDFPHLKDTYKYDNSIIKIEHSTNNFIKRVSIKSEKLNLSINILNCNFDKIEKKYFKHFDFEEYGG
tara:strand:- start:7891 stop:8364 length:474 start_codon:yes stop_codon:yes gene_type:complete